MYIQGDVRSTPFVVQSLLEHECQFFLTHKNGKRLRVAFHEGTWKLMLNTGESFQLYDAGTVTDCDSPVLKAFIQERLEARKSRHENWFRTYPAMVMVDTINIWLGNLENVESIDVTQAGRDGWFERFED